ncbi:MAG: P22 phage major capsid protein family protein [Candidatus Competibacter sp.]|nr:P22 phage major capsid protein family protein [Candidatus Competibacter sp.]
MANTLTNLIPDIYAALDVVSRELVGFIPAVGRDSSADRVAINQTLRIPISPANAAGGNITPAMAFPSAADQTFTNKTLTITKSRFFPFSWSGQEEMAVNSGVGYLTLKQDQIAQAIRAAINEMESDIATAAYLGASRAYSSHATTPPAVFGTAGDYSDAANVRKILDDNGAPLSDRTLVVNTTAGAAIRGKQAQAYMAGDTSLQRNGVLFDINGFAIRESAQVPTVTAGSMSGGVMASGALTVGQTSLALKNATGTGTVAAGDIITLANDTNKYVVAAASFAGANPATGDTITLAAPGIRMAQSAAERAITVVGSSTRNIAFSRNAILLATRLPHIPGEGDLASDRMSITDPISGISLEFAVYPGFRMNVYHVSVAWGVTVIKPEHCAILLGN